MMDSLSNTYKLKDDLLEEYLLERYLLLNKINKISNFDLENFCNFIADELFIKVESNSFSYKGSLFYVHSKLGQSIYNIVINLPLFSKISGVFHMSSSDSTKIQKIEKHVNDVIRKGKNKIAKISKTYKEYVYKDYVLTQLNEYYGVVPDFIVIPPGIESIKEEYYSGRNLESVYKSHVHSMLFNSNNNDLKLEKDIESYLYKNIKKVFPNKKILSRQKNIGNGCIVDMILEDEDFEYILELKNKKDDRLYWQVIKYYNYYKMNRKPVKVISLAPEYSEEMLTSLKELDYLDIYEFSIRIENNKISDMLVTRIEK